MWEKLNNLDRRWIYLLVLVVVAFALVSPMGLSISINEPAQQAFDAINALKAGDIMYVAFDFDAGSMTEIYPATYSAVRLAFQKNIRVVAAAAWDQGGAMAKMLFADLATEFNKEYGKDYVNLGYKPGGTIFFEKLTRNVNEATAGIDINGTAIDQIPLMKDFKTVKDAKLIFAAATGTPGIREYIAIVGTPHKVPITGACVAVSTPEYMPYLQAGQLKGLAMGMRGAAELEILTGKPGSAVAGMDAQSLAHLMVVGLIIVGNIGYFASKKKSS